jgi:pimeloyl-ACP methyl ester carboxylesterase
MIRLWRLPILAAAAAAASVATLSHPRMKMSRRRPTTVLIHGLDSSKQTWDGVICDLERAGYPAVAVDLCGHGESPLGNPSAFSPRSLADGVLETVAAVDGPYVVVGHSMGGRIAMRLAADRGEDVAALIIEDMDVAERQRAGPLSPEGKLSLERFERPDDSGRRFADWPEAVTALTPWYTDDRIQGWKGKRIRQRDAAKGGGWWCDLNPFAMRLARDRVLASNDGAEAWSAMKERSFPIHLWIADPNFTVVDEASIDNMISQDKKANLRRFPGAAHSIHNTARADFVEGLKEIVDEAALHLSDGQCDS